MSSTIVNSTVIERPRPETTSRSKKRHCSSFLGTRASAIEEEKTKRLQKVVKSTQYEEDLHKEQLKYEAKRMELVVIQIANAKEKKALIELKKQQSSKELHKLRLAKFKNEC
uniref:Uncharacterized protein n=1 Tax=Cacopsylla melanoneura TaxID=428564 RepID=A0A8D8Z7U3_9HEMI